MRDKMTNRSVILVTAVGTAAATAVVLELKKTGKYYIIGADMRQETEIATSKDVDRFCVFPPSVCNFEQYIKFVLAFCKENNVEYYYAIVDKEVVNLAEHKWQFDEIGVKLCIANLELVKKCHYKDQFSEWVKINIPDIYIHSFEKIEDITDADFPVFVKPVEGYASIGCRKINNREQLMEFVYGKNNEKNVIIQEYLEGEIIAVDLVRNALTGQMMQLQRKELVRNSSGCGIAVEIINDRVLNGICEEIMVRLNLNGVISAEFLCKEGQYKIIEINPRLSAGTSFSCMAGLNTVMNALEIADGRHCEFGGIAVGKHFTKRYETCAMD